MAGHSRYNVSAKGAGVVGNILKNKLGIKDQKTLDDAEAILLSDTYSHFFSQLEKSGLTFNSSLLFQIHAYFLGTLYSWAGKLRRVNISKDDVLFAPAEYLEHSLQELDAALTNYIPTSRDTKTRVAKKLAFIHNELNALHPFREGNGRTIRLFLDLLAANAKHLPIDWDRAGKTAYINACKLGMIRDHDAMAKVIGKGLLKK